MNIKDLKMWAVPELPEEAVKFLEAGAMIMAINKL